MHYRFNRTIFVILFFSTFNIISCSSDNNDNNNTSLIDAAIIKDGGSTDVPQSLDQTSQPDLLINTEMGITVSNSFCRTPKTLTLNNGRVEEKGNNILARDEFTQITNQVVTNAINCNNPLVKVTDSSGWVGPQLYFKVTLQGGKKYKALVTADYDVGIYAFPASTACTINEINQACTNPLPRDFYNTYNNEEHHPTSTKKEDSEIVWVAPTSTSNWIFVVDTLEPDAVGQYTLTIVEHIPVSNATCMEAKVLSLTNGEVTETGNTTDADNEFTTPIQCGTGIDFKGPQLYYKVKLAKDKIYTFTLTPTFKSYMYLFSATCNVADINKYCGSSGVTGKYVDVKANIAGELIFKVTTEGNYILAVDSTNGMDAGSFELNIKETNVAPIDNGKCITPKTVDLITSPVTEQGDTNILNAGQPVVNNEFEKQIKCGRTGSFGGNQLYYRLSLKAGKTYTIEVTPTDWDAAIYAFIWSPKTAAAETICDPTKINADCTTMVIDDGGKSEKDTLVIKPTTDNDYVIAVDGIGGAGGKGPFTMVISWK